MNTDRHLWEFRWVRDLFYLAIIVTIMIAAYATRAIMLPLLIALMLAYIVNPLLTLSSQRWRIPRLAATVTIMLALTIALLGLVLWIVPSLITQTGQLLDKLAEYVSWLIDKMEPQIQHWTNQIHSFAPSMGEFDAEAAAAPRSDKTTLTDQIAQLDLDQIGAFLLTSLNIGVGVVGSAISLTAYLGLAIVVFSFCFFFFSWKFNRIIAWWDPFIAAGNRNDNLQLIKSMDRAVSAFVRGRLIQSLVMMMILSVGWLIADVPYWLLLGIGSGLLNLVPYAAAIGWITATILTLIDHLSSLPLDSTFQWSILFWPTVVYAIAQLIDGWIVEPVVQGKATDLDPLTVLLAVLIAGSLFGLFGLILAIPLTSCCKIIAQQRILPHLRQWAAGPTQKPS